MSLAVLSFLRTMKLMNRKIKCPVQGHLRNVTQEVTHGSHTLGETQTVAFPRYRCNSKVAHGFDENFVLSGLIHFTVPLQIQNKGQGLPMWLGSAAALI